MESGAGRVGRANLASSGSAWPAATQAMRLATAALPGFLRSIGAPAAALGAIEGIADGALSFSKLGGGILVDRPGVERRAVVAGGYAVTAALGHGSFALFGAWPLVALARSLSWMARGSKGPRRDTLLAGSVTTDQLGRAFGVERAMDSAGAVVGPLLAAPLIVAVGYRWLFATSLIPGLLAALSVLLLVREVPRVAREAATALHPIRTLLATPGAFQRLLVGVGLFGVSCVLFAIAPASIVILAVLFGMVGVSRALVETGQGSYAAELLPDNIRGRGFGLIGLVDALGDLVANVVVGVLFTLATLAAGFVFAAVMSSAGAATLLRPSLSSAV